MQQLKPAIIGLPASLAWITLGGIQQGIQVISTFVGLVIACVSLWMMLRNMRKQK